MSTPVEAERPTSGLWGQTQALVRWVKVALWVALGLLAVIIAAEAFRVYVLARNAHPLLGVAAVALIGVGLVLLALPVVRFLRVPAAVRPPPLPPRDAVRIPHLQVEAQYLSRYLASCARNPELAERATEIEAARREIAAWVLKLRSAPPERCAELSQELGEWVQSKVAVLLTRLDERTERLIYQEALAVGLGTAVSPNGTLDSFVMLWRSVSLVSRIAEMYYGRPGVWGTFAVCRDVAIATAVAGTIHNVTDSLGSLLAKSLGGFAGVVAGPAVEGVTNALVLVRIGYLARERCRSFRRWDLETRRGAVLASLAATQKVALGLTTELLRQVGSGLGAVAAGALSLGQKVGEKISSLWRGKKPEEEPVSE